MTDRLSISRQRHFAKRVRERIGPSVDPYMLAECLRRAIETGSTDYVQFVARLSKSGKRLFRFRLRDGRVFYVVMDTDSCEPVTILTPEMGSTPRQGRPDIILEGAAE